MIPEEKADQIKQQIIQQIEQNLPEDQQESTKQHILSMNPEELEEFLKRNNVQIKEQEESSDSGQQCIFCSIVFGDIESHKISENESAIAVLEINPLSKGHILIIPKDHITSTEKLPQDAIDLAKEMSEKIKSLLSPKDIIVKETNLFGHEIINVIPVYENESLESKRYRAEKSELEEMKSILEKGDSSEPQKESKHLEKKEKILGENAWFPKRIP